MAALAGIMTIAIHAANAALGAPNAANHGTPDNWFTALTKLIPGESIVAFHAALLIPGVAQDRAAHLTILILLTAMVPVVLWASGRQGGTKAPWLQYLVRPAAFLMYGLSSDAVFTEWLDHLSWIPGVGGLVIALLAALMLSPPGA